MKKLLPHFSASRLLTTVFVLSLISSGLYFTNVYAQDQQESQFIDIIPTITTAEDPEAPLPAETTDEAIHLSPDKSEIIKLDRDASSIIIGNPAHLSVLADTPSLLVLVPKAVGATHFTVLDKKGNIIMQRHVLVAGPNSGYIRVKKTCPGDLEGCQATSVYYCPDTCHEIVPSGSEDKQTSVAAPAPTE